MLAIQTTNHSNTGYKQGAGDVNDGMHTMTKKDDLDIPKEWTIHEEATDTGGEKTEKGDGQESIFGNVLLWALFIGVFLGIVALPYLFGGAQKELQSISLNGVNISAEANPITAVSSLSNAHIDGGRLDNSTDANNALNEIYTVIGQSGDASAGKYTLFAGVSDRTGIKLEGNTVYITGKDKRDFWTAVWTFNSIVSDTDIDSEVDLYGVQDLLRNRKGVYLVQDMDHVCAPYAHIISAEGDILSSLGYRQAQWGFNLHHYEKDSGGCRQFENESATVACPTPSRDDFVISMRESDTEGSKFTITENGITFEYADCNSVDKVSAILRDMLYPNIITSLGSVKFPTYM